MDDCGGAPAPFAAGMASSGGFGSGSVSCGMAGEFWRGGLGSGAVGQVRQVGFWRSMAWFSAAWQARRGGWVRARRGWVRFGAAGVARSVMVRSVPVRQDNTGVKYGDDL